MIKPDPDSCHLLLDSRLANEEVQKIHTLTITSEKSCRMEH